MENINEIKDILTRVMDMLESQFGRDCEVVLHDHSLDYDHTIVDIRNSHVTGRKIGDSGSNLGLEILRGTATGVDKYNYITYTNNGKVLRSSSIHFKNSKEELIGALCVNLDITKSKELEKFIKDYNNFNTTPDQVNEILVSDVQQLLDELIKRTFQKIGKPTAQMTRQDKIEFIKLLDEKGAFFITKSSKIVGDALDISKYTFYSYLELARGKETNENDENIEN